MLYKLKDSDFFWKVIFTDDVLHEDTMIGENKMFDKNDIFLDLGSSFQTPVGLLIKVLHESKKFWIYKNCLEEL